MSGDTNNELEDFLMSVDESFIEEMRETRAQHQRGELEDIEEIE